MRFMVAAKVSTDPLGHFVSREEAGGLNDSTLAVHPVGLNAIEPRTLARQKAGHDAHSLVLLPDLAIVGADPGAYLLAKVPGSIVPDQDQGGLAERLQFLAAPGQVLGGQWADRAILDEAQPDLCGQALRCGRRRDQQAITGQGLRVWIVLGRRLFHQAQFRVLVTPGMQGRLADAAPPHFVLEAQGILGMLPSQGNQPVSLSFFFAYAGSGLVIQCLARFQRTPNRCKAVRTASRLTRKGVMPCSKLTSAASSKLHRLVAFPKWRGLWCSNAPSCSGLAPSKAVAIRCGTEEPRCKAAKPTWLKARIPFSAVSVSQCSSCAICDARLPLALASTIWQRRTTKASCERSPCRKAACSSSVKLRT